MPFLLPIAAMFKSIKPFQFGGGAHIREVQPEFPTLDSQLNSAISIYCFMHVILVIMLASTLFKRDVSKCFDKRKERERVRRNCSTENKVVRFLISQR